MFQRRRVGGYCDVPIPGGTGLEQHFRDKNRENQQDSKGQGKHSNAVEDISAVNFPPTAEIRRPRYASAATRQVYVTIVGATIGYHLLWSEAAKRVGDSMPWKTAR